MIQLTKKQFMEAVSEACKQWNDVPVEDRDPAAEALMMIQNMTFGAMLATILFNDDEEDK